MKQEIARPSIEEVIKWLSPPNRMRIMRPLPSIEEIRMPTPQPTWNEDHIGQSAAHYLTTASVFLKQADAEIASLKTENDLLRAKLANSNAACVYCGLSAGDMNKCAHGFPGCARADDAVLDPDFGKDLQPVAINDNKTVDE